MNGIKLGRTKRGTLSKELSFPGKENTSANEILYYKLPVEKHHYRGFDYQLTISVGFFGNFYW